METELIDEIVLDAVGPLILTDWNRLQEKVWFYLVFDRRGDTQRLQALRALVKRGFWTPGNTFEECKQILAEYELWLEKYNGSGEGEDEDFCGDGMERFRMSMRSQDSRPQDMREGCVNGAI